VVSRRSSRRCSEAACASSGEAFAARSRPLDSVNRQGDVDVAMQRQSRFRYPTRVPSAIRRLAQLLICMLAACLTRDQQADHAAPREREWRVDSLPRLDIASGSLTEPVVLDQPVAGTVLRDGTIVVAEGIGGSIRFFGPDGHPIRTVGRPGSGPGEFRLISWMGRCWTDSLFVWDFMQARVSVLDSRGRLGRVYHLPPEPETGPAPAVLACSPQGVFAFVLRPTSVGDRTREGPFARSYGRLVLADAAGNVSNSIGDVPVGEMIASMGMVPRPLGRRTSVAVSTQYMYVGTADSPFVNVYSLDGQYIKALALGTPSRQATDADYERAVDAELQWTSEESFRRRLRDRLLKAERPKALPPYTALLVDSEEVLWVVVSTPGEPTTWLRGLRDGAIVADLLVPTSMTPFEVGSDHVLGVHEDQNGVQHLVLYGFRRPIDRNRD
jgi:hypothetical protein